MKTKIHPDWKKRIARIARKLWHYEADRREGRDTVEAVLRAAGHKLESPMPNPQDERPGGQREPVLRPSREL